MVRQMKTVVFFLVAFAFCPLLYAQVYSTIQGGPWSDPATWQGGNVPTANDDVVIVGPVQLDQVQDYFINSLKIQQNGSLRQVAYSQYREVNIFVATDVWNQGTIEGNGTIEPYIYIGRDLFNEGTWLYTTIIFKDTASHIFRSLPGSNFMPSKVLADSATLISDRDFVIQSPQGVNTRIKANKLILLKDFASLPTTFRFLKNTILEVNEIVGNGNSIAGDSSSYVERFQTEPVVSNLRIKNTVNLDTDVTVNDTLIVEDTLKIRDRYHYYSVIELRINGDIINYGTIIPNIYGERFSFYVSGNIENRGHWYGSRLEFTSDSTQHLYCDTSFVFTNTYVYGDEDTIVAKGSIRFDDSWISLQKLVLKTGHPLVLDNETTLFFKTIEGNGSTILFRNGSYISKKAGMAVLDRVALDGDAQFYGARRYHFTGNLVIRGKLSPAQATSSTAYFTVLGDITNYGQIERNPNNAALEFEIHGNLYNAGNWESLPVKVVGNQPQQLTFRDSASFQPQVWIYSDRTGNSYQWFRGDSALSNSSYYSNVNRDYLKILTIVPEVFGTYYCRVDSSGDTLYSREVILWDGVTGIDSQENRPSVVAQDFELIGNYPNPFNASTFITYRIPHRLPIQLRIYDIQGRMVDAIDVGWQPAGKHRIQWQASQFSSGIYFYEIQAGPYRDVKKMVLVK
ncbi:MAG: T9SS type A sorting domain-containing protein [Calditrichaeota bacterium]|nr:T9SS type A sorting domain-containing protein [Calditrichota bacterium]